MPGAKRSFRRAAAAVAQQLSRHRQERKEETHTTRPDMSFCSTSVYHLFLVYLRCSTLAFSCSCASWDNNVTRISFLSSARRSATNAIGADGLLNFLLGWGWRAKPLSGHPGTRCSALRFVGFKFGFCVCYLAPVRPGTVVEVTQGGGKTEPGRARIAKGISCGGEGKKMGRQALGGGGPIPAESLGRRKAHLISVLA